MNSKLVKKFFMIKYHTDSQLSDFLQENAQNNLAFVKTQGNYFYFEKHSYDGRRICARTLYRTGDEFSTEMQVREELARIRKTGWDCLAIGKQETLKDTKRHVYLIEEIKDAELPPIDDRSEKRAEIREKFKSISNLALCALYVATVAILFSNSLVKVVTNNLYIVFSAIFTLLLTACSVLCLWSFLNAFFIRKENRITDVATKLLSVCLIMFALFLFADSMLEDKGESERIKIGATSYKVYSDKIDVNLDTLGFDTSAPYRTTRHTESESFIAKYSYNFDESFGVKEGENIYDTSTKQEVCFISYSIFTSANKKLLNVIASQNVPSGAIRNTDLEKATGAEQVYTANNNALVVFKNNSVLTVKSGITLNSAKLAKLVSLL